jgi:hypothetical protein
LPQLVVCPTTDAANSLETYSMRPDENTTFAAELSLLRGCLRLSLSGEDHGTDLLPLIRSVNWHHVLWLGRRHRVLLALHHFARSSAGVAVPAEIRAQLGVFHEVNELRALERGGEAALIQDAFASQKIPAAVLCSWTFAQRHYRQRRLREVERSATYLVRPGDRPRAEVALRQLGYDLADDPFRFVTRDRSRLLLESLPASATDIDQPGHWNDLETFHSAGRTLHTLSPVAWLIRLCQRGAGYSWSRLLDASDVVALTQSHPTLDWVSILAQAEQAGLTSVVVGGIAASHAALELPIPEVVLRRHDPADFGGTSAQKSPDAARSASAAPPTLPSPVFPGHELAYLGRYFPTPPRIVSAMLRLAGTNASDVVYDLGCGDGRIAIAAAKEFGARGVGLDIDPQRIAEATSAAKAQGVAGRVSFACADVLLTPVADATVVCVYLQGFAYPEIRRKLEQEMPVGTRIVSHDFVFPQWAPERTELVRHHRTKISQIYVWHIGPGVRTPGPEAPASPPVPLAGR